jgi:hypothetical protein
MRLLEPRVAIREITIDRRFRPEPTFKFFDGTASAPPDFYVVVAETTSASLQQFCGGGRRWHTRSVT